MRTIKEDLTDELVEELAQYIATLIKKGGLDRNNADAIVLACDAFMTNAGFQQRRTEIEETDRVHARFLARYAMTFYGDDAQC